MRTRACWFALVVTGGLAVGPAFAQIPTGGLDVGRANPVVPLPIYNARPESGGFYTALEFVMYRMTRNFKQQVIARRGLVDDDGSIQAGLGGTFRIDPITGQTVFVPGLAGAPGTFL